MAVLTAKDLRMLRSCKAHALFVTGLVFASDGEHEGYSLISVSADRAVVKIDTTPPRS